MPAALGTVGVSRMASAATVVGIPLGILCDRVPPVRTAILNTLNAVQTIPSIALFGLLIAPLAWVGANVPGAAALGIAGIGAAPAMLALTLTTVANVLVTMSIAPLLTALLARLTAAGVPVCGFQEVRTTLQASYDQTGVSGRPGESA